ncbi:C-type lectin domain family 17, member A-like [Penaeus monodon]|uniref:C-type lectin domain family 17, member A-like n=1 Tax=Penaeus monodon TaxID=6687 RepID=UPI0018A731A6|nr:C-type lectin domain family 17, member A-like [Penaeus monodon]
MLPPRPLLLALTVACGAAVACGALVEASDANDVPPGASDVPGYLLSMLMWSGEASERYHRSPLVPAALAATATHVVTACPAPFFPVMSQCFWTSTKYELSWDDARSFCQQMGGDLATPLYLNALMVYLQDHYSAGKEFHLGASDLEEEGNWNYLSGRPVDPRGWMPGEPNDPAHDQNCLNFCFEGCTASYPPLNDQYCHRKKNFVCEFFVAKE